jgi:NADH-quinone oxidoreductase subunit J
LFIFQFEFLPIAFLIIYVGAIAVLLLFVLMMLNIKVAEIQQNFDSFLPAMLLLSFVFVLAFVCLFIRVESLSILNLASIQHAYDYLNFEGAELTFIDKTGILPNLKSVSLILFTDYLFSFIIAGFVLLLAMVAAITLTIHKSFVSNTQNVYNQVMADFENTIVNFK